MNVKLYSYIIFFCCVTLGLQNVSAQHTDMTFTTNDGDKKCTRKYTTCRLDFNGKGTIGRGQKGEAGSNGLDGHPGVAGAKGDQGIPGLDGHPGVAGAEGNQGIRGRDGYPGVSGKKGERGIKGSPGMDGVKGDRGENGKMGSQGPPGITGEKGVSGSDGPQGPPGVKGEKGASGLDGPAGPMGLSGPVGPPGIPGRPGVCPCTRVPNIEEFVEPNDDFGNIESPGEVPCKEAPAGTVNGYYYLGPTKKPIKVYCNMKSLETCITINKTTTESNHNSATGGFWLNEKNVHMKELYYNISTEQLTWLRDRSESVRQTLKYNCLDSVPYSKHNMAASVKLWAWNDVVIGPYPTTQSPIFYSVPEGTDKCEPGSTEWKSTIIELQSSNVYRLPIVDLWIGDIRNADQKMSIESVDLCFA